MSKPVLFIPGYPGSDLYELDKNNSGTLNKIWAELTGPKDAKKLYGPIKPDSFDNIFAPWAVRFKSKHLKIDVHTSLFEFLEENLGYQWAHPAHFGPSSTETSLYIPMGWDWRLPISHMQTHYKVGKYIEDLQSLTNEGVVVIVHSTGGLLFRTWLEQSARPSQIMKIDHVICIGVPWLGTLASLANIVNPEIFKWFMTLSRSDDVVAHSHAAYDLMPTPQSGLLRYLKGKKNADALRTRWRGGLHDRVIQFRQKSANARFGNMSREPYLHGPNGAAVPFPVTNLYGWGHKGIVRGWLRKKKSWWQKYIEFDSELESDGTLEVATTSVLDGQGVPTGSGVTNIMSVPCGYSGDKKDKLFEERIKHVTLFASPIVHRVIDGVVNGPAGGVKPTSAPYLSASLQGKSTTFEETFRINVSMYGPDLTPLAPDKVSLSFSFNGYSVTGKSKTADGCEVFELEISHFSRNEQGSVQTAKLTTTINGKIYSEKIPLRIPRKWERE